MASSWTSWHSVGGAAVVAVALAWTGCAEKSAIPRPPPSQCVKGPARPIAVQRVIQALRTGGFHVYGDPDRQCDPGGSVVRLENLFFSGPHENIGSADEVEQREGQVVCNVFRRTMAGITTRHPRRLYEFAPPDPTNKGAWFLVANVDCRVYTPRRPIVERFRTGMRALRQGLGR